jgi:hypothetical protein
MDKIELSRINNLLHGNARNAANAMQPQTKQRHYVDKAKNGNHNW